MSNRDLIASFMRRIVQITSPYYTGSGFYLSEYKLFVTNEHVVRDQKEVLIEGLGLKQQMAEVIYVDELYDLAFLKIEKTVDLERLEISSRKLNIGDEVYVYGSPMGLELEATRGVISDLRYMVNGISFLRYDTTMYLGNSGGPLINGAGEVIGVNCPLHKTERNIGYAIPFESLKETLDTFYQGENQLKAVRCNSCFTIIHEGHNRSKSCLVCGKEINYISDLKGYKPIGICRTIESVLSDLGYNVALTRQGVNQWEVKRGSATIALSYYEKSGLIVGESTLCMLSNNNLDKIYTYLLQQNDDLRGLSFSIRGMEVVLSILIYDQYLNESSGKTLLNGLFEKSDHYDDILVKEWGAVWK